MQRVIKILLLVFLGIFVGVVAYEAIMFIRVSRLRSENPLTTSMIESRAKEAQTSRQQPKREQIWVALDRISPNLQRAVLAGEDTNFATHNGFDYKALQKALSVFTAIVVSQGPGSDSHNVFGTDAVEAQTSRALSERH